MNDHYTILGVLPDATFDEIKVAFRQLAQAQHPDHGGDEEEFKKINEAYDILSDPDKRQQYDYIRSLLVPSEDAPTLKPQAGMMLERPRTCIVKRSVLSVMAFMGPVSNVNILIRDCGGILASEHILITASGTPKDVRDFFDSIEYWVV